MMKSFLWKWELFFGNCYTIFDKDKNKIRKILIYRKRIYLLD